jgi:hypothetical protein
MKRNAPWKNPLWIGAACAAAATGLGVAYLTAAGAPAVYGAINLGALALGLTVLARRPPRVPGGAVLVLGALLLATAWFGVSVEGATRWVRVSSLTLQVSLLALPVMVVAFAQRRDPLSWLGIVLAAVALALQPDRAMAGALVAGLAALAALRPDRRTTSALGVAAASFGVTLLRPDTLPATPSVERVLLSAFEVHAGIGLAVLCGAALLVVPAVAGWFLDGGNREAYAAFGAVWLGAVVASVLGNYPTPLVGFGGSAVLGYALSLASMPGPLRSASARVAGARRVARGPDERGTPLHAAPAR